MRTAATSFQFLLSLFTNLYAVWVIAASILAFLIPELFRWFSGPWVTWALSVIMLGMGLTLSLADFRKVWEMPRPVALGFVAQYTIMPATAWTIARLMNLDPPFAVGLILVACCPGGTASNVVAFLSKANVALSVVLTMASTILAIVMTPLLMQIWAGHYVPVDAAGIFKTTLQVVLLPVMFGVFLNHRFPRIGEKASSIGPAVAVLAIVMIAGSIVARNVEAIIGQGPQLALAGFLLHAGGFALGYGVTRVLRFSEITARTISIEVGMQNSGLAMVLAGQHFAPPTAAPAVFSSVFHTLLGSLLAAYWRRNRPAEANCAGQGGRAAASLTSSVEGHPRRSIHYWKCDRPAAFHGTTERAEAGAYESQLAEVLRKWRPEQTLALQPAGGQGNHITWRATAKGTDYFVRIEDGPERDDYIEVESRILAEVRGLGVPTPRVFGVDASRKHAPFAWQVLEHIACPDLNQIHKEGRLNLAKAAGEIGAAAARWQNVTTPGFGPFDPAVLRSEDRLEGFHPRYEDYFFLHLQRHLSFLAQHGMLTAVEAEEIRAEIEHHRGLLALEQGFLVHKDLALWNILGTETEIAAFIDWDDAVSGDPMDDLSLLGCFYDGKVLAHALEGYASLRPLPGQFRRRFWLHLLRNMIVKAVIRVGAGYFDRDDGFFLIHSGGTGQTLKAFTHARLAAALKGLREDQEIETL